MGLITEISYRYIPTSCNIKKTTGNHEIPLDTITSKKKYSHKTTQHLYDLKKSIDQAVNKERYLVEEIIYSKETLSSLNENILDLEKIKCEDSKDKSLLKNVDSLLYKKKNERLTMQKSLSHLQKCYQRSRQNTQKLINKYLEDGGEIKSLPLTSKSLTIPVYNNIQESNSSIFERSCEIKYVTVTQLSHEELLKDQSIIHSSFQIENHVLDHLEKQSDKTTKISFEREIKDEKKIDAFVRIMMMTTHLQDTVNYHDLKMKYIKYLENEMIKYNEELQKYHHPVLKDAADLKDTIMISLAGLFKENNKSKALMLTKNIVVTLQSLIKELDNVITDNYEENERDLRNNIKHSSYIISRLNGHSSTIPILAETRREWACKLLQIIEMQYNILKSEDNIEQITDFFIYKITKLNVTMPW